MSIGCFFLRSISLIQYESSLHKYGTTVVLSVREVSIYVQEVIKRLSCPSRHKMVG